MIVSKSKCRLIDTSQTIAIQLKKKKTKGVITMENITKNELAYDLDSYGQITVSKSESSTHLTVVIEIPMKYYRVSNEDNDNEVLVRDENTPTVIELPKKLEDITIKKHVFKRINHHIGVIAELISMRENGGVSRKREKALEYAKLKYMCFEQIYKALV